MKKVLTILLFLLCFSAPLNAEKIPRLRSMLNQVCNVNIALNPIIGNALYTIQTSKGKVDILRMYNSGEINSDPQHTDVQAVFLNDKLIALVFSPNDLTSNVLMLGK